MPDLVVRPEVTVTAELRKASSDCHGAKLDPGPEPGAYLCRECGQPCERILADPVEVTASG